MKKVAIIGYGRFGKTLHRLIKNDFDVVIYSRAASSPKPKTDNTTADLKTVYRADTIFYCVPIHLFEEVIKEHRPYIKPTHTLIDVLSVKLHPKHIFEKYITSIHTQTQRPQIILTHPLFGPDSSGDGFDDLPIVMDQCMSDKETYSFWKKYFIHKKLRVIEMPSDRHDRLAAKSQGLTHFIGRLLQEIDFKQTSIDTLGAHKLYDVMEQTCHDSWDLFHDLQQYNPYTRQMRLDVGESFNKLYNKLLPERIDPHMLTIGIQGGRGSFNEEALSYFVKKHKIAQYRTVYLHTTENVLKALYRGEIDYGQFATHNSVGGTVTESIRAMAHYRFKIIDHFEIKIAHALMMHSDAKREDIDTIMTHPQVLKQCGQTLKKKYPHLKKASGKGNLVDHAEVAKQLSEQKLPKTIATMGSKVLAKLYGLTIIEDNLQDAAENYTSFMMVKRLG